MSRILHRTAGVITLDRDGIAASQTPGAAGPLTLNGVGVSGGIATLTPPRRVAIFSGSNIAARVFTVTGTDRNGAVVTDTITGINNTTVSTRKLFKTVTSISVDAATGAAVEAGWTATSITSWIHVANLNHVRVGVDVPAGATVTYSIEATMENLLRDQVPGYEPAVTVIVPLATAASATLDLLTPWSAVRLVVATQDAALTLRAIPTGFG
jgi:hypothetical protein